MEQKAKSAYEHYELAKQHFSAAQFVEDVFRQGFIMGYCTAKDERKPRRQKNKAPAE